MSIPGYAKYKKREYCHAVKCPVQEELNRHKPGTVKYEEIRKRCKSACVHTTHEFHAWLIEKGYEVIRPAG